MFHHQKYNPKLTEILVQISEDKPEATESSVVTPESSVITEARELLADAEDEDNENLDIFGIVNTQLKEI